MQVRPPLQCALPAAGGALTVWVPATTVEVEGAQVTARTAVEGGTRLRLAVPPGARVVRVDATGEPKRRAQLELVAAPECPAVDEARGLRRSDPAAARARLAEVSEACAPSARALMARLILDAGAIEAGLDLLAALRAEIAGHDRKRWFDDGVAALYTLTWRAPDLPRAQALAAELLAADDPIAGRARVAYHAAQLALEAGALREAEPLFADALARARRLGLQRRIDGAIAGRARLWATRGRFAEADRDLAALTATEDDCAAAVAWGNLGWHRLRARNKGHTIEAPGAALERALRAAEACGRPSYRANAHLNLAFAALQDRRPAAVERHLAATLSAQRPLDAFMAEHHGLFTAIHARRTGDLARASAALDGFEPAPFSENAWWRLVERGNIAAAGGRVEAAERWWIEADGLAGRALALVPVHGDRGGFLGARDRAAARLVDSLASRGQPGPARVVARQAIARLGRALDPADSARHRSERARYHQLRAQIERQRAALRTAPADTVDAARAELNRVIAEARAVLDGAYARIAPPSDALPPTGSGVLELVLHPGHERWWVLATDATGTTAHPFARVDALSALAPALLGPIAERLRGARRIELHVAGRLAELDLHALPFDGRPLWAHAPVVWRFELGRGANPPAGGTLIVRDPRGDLPAARTLMTPGAQVLHQAAATRAAVLAALPTAGAFIYGGHGHHDGWSGALALGRGTELTVSDIATLPAAPTRVLLAGCETGVGAREGRLEVGLAHAFLLAGSEQVIGATREVPDAVAQRLTEHILGHGIPSADALRSAQVTLSREMPSVDWAAFRVWAR